MKPSHASLGSHEDPVTEDRAATPSVGWALFPEVLSYATHSLSRFSVPEADRDELAQEVVIAAYKKRHEYDPRRAKVCQWCRGFVINIVRNYGRKNHVIMGPFRRAHAGARRRKPGPEEHYMAKAHHRLLHDVLLPQVTFDARVVVIAYDLDGLDLKTIAAQEDIPISTAHARYKSGRRQLQAAYDRHQRQQKARGLAVMPFTLAHLLAADRTIPDLPLALVNRTWSRVERALAEQARWQALRVPWRRPELLLAPTFLAGATVGALLFSLFQSPPRSDVVIMQPDPAKGTSVGVISTSAPSMPPPALVALSAPPMSSASRRDFRDAKRDFEVAFQSFKRGSYDAATAALAAHERNYPASSFAGERTLLRARIAEKLRDTSGRAPAVNQSSASVAP